MNTVPTTDLPALGRVQQRALIIGALALLAAVIGAVTNLDQFQSWLIQFYWSWLVGALFCLNLALGSLALLMLQHISGGQWGLVGRRIYEAASRTLPFVALLFIPVILGLSKIFIWAQPQAVAASHVLQEKTLYLNGPFFVIRLVLYFGFWTWAMWQLNKWSQAQDRGEAVTKRDSVRFRKVSAPGLLFLVITVTFASVDWVMSLEPEWFSTIFGLLTVVGYGLTALAFTILVLALVNRSGVARSYLTSRHFHDYGKLLLAFVMLWAYLSFSQFLIIWSGNLPEEIPWYIARIRGSWGAVAMVIVIGHFALPFAALLSADLKKKSGTLAVVAAWVLLMRLIDIIWYVAPASRLAKGAGETPPLGLIPFHWMDLAIPIGLTAVWVFLFVRQFRARALFPVNDPYFKEAFAHDVAH